MIVLCLCFGGCNGITVNVLSLLMFKNVGVVNLILISPMTDCAGVHYRYLGVESSVSQDCLSIVLKRLLLLIELFLCHINSPIASNKRSILTNIV